MYPQIFVITDGINTFGQKIFNSSEELERAQEDVRDTDLFWRTESLIADFKNLKQCCENAGIKIIQSDEGAQYVLTENGYTLGIAGIQYSVQAKREYFDDILDLEAWMSGKKAA